MPIRNTFLTWLFILYGSSIAAQKLPLLRVVETGVKASFRALSVVNNRVAWVAGSQGTVGRTTDGGQHWQFETLVGFENHDFRTLYAFDSLTALVANAGSPGVILRTENGGKSWTEVYRNAHPDVFLDGTDFEDDHHGLVYGDPIGGRMLLLRTNDGGRSWMEIPEKNRPALDSGEASFAASGTNIRSLGQQKYHIATGGKISRLWTTEDNGNTWKPTPVPILQGKASQGIFSIAEAGNILMAAGGDYLADTLKKDHIYYSENGGKTWKFPQKPTGGYRECVAHIEKNMWIAVGPSGIDISHDGGKNWRPISAEKGFHTIRMARKGKRILLAGSKGKLGVLSWPDSE